MNRSQHWAPQQSTFCNLRPRCFFTATAAQGISRAIRSCIICIWANSYTRALSSITETSKSQFFVLNMPAKKSNLQCSPTTTTQVKGMVGQPHSHAVSDVVSKHDRILQRDLKVEKKQTVHTPSILRHPQFSSLTSVEQTESLLI